MDNEKNFKEVHIGNVYKRRDGLLAFIYKFEPVTNYFMCIIQDTGEVFPVDEYGNYSGNNETHNDLVMLVK